MRRRLAVLATAAALTLTVAACGSSDDDPEPAQQGSPGSSETPETSDAPEPEVPDDEITVEQTGELPSYEEVKAIWRANTTEIDRNSCDTQENEDKSVHTLNDGDYLRYMCAGIVRFTYVTGADNYSSNFELASRDLTGRAVFHIPGEAFVAPSGADRDMAVAIQEACGCGEVVGPEN